MNVPAKVAALTHRSCTKCNTVKPVADFTLNMTGYNPACRVCVSAKNKAYYDKNRPKVLARKAELGEERAAGVAPPKDVGALQRRQATPFDEKYADRREQVNARNAKRLQEDPQFRQYKLVDNRWRRALQAWDHTLETQIGCTVQWFQEWIEWLMVPGMDWDNYGTNWGYDHVKPRSLFNLFDSDEVEECHHWTNLRPMVMVENSIKHVNYTQGIADDQEKLVYIFELIQGN